MKKAGFFLVFASLVLSGCASMGGSGLSANQLQQIGEKFLIAGDTASALKNLTEAEQKKPGSAVIQYDLGLAYHQRAMLTEAAAHLQKALQLKPDYSEALNALGAVQAESGQYELARESFEKALADPFYKTPQLAAYNLGSLYEKKGDPDRALREYDRAIKLQAGYGPAWYRKGQILETMKRGDEAREAYGKAIAGAPDLADAHLRYGIMSYQAGDIEAAIFSLYRVTKLAPNSNLSSEAKLYLSRLKEVAQTQQGPYSRDISPAEIDVISRREIERQQVKAAVAQASAGKPATISPEEFTVTPGRTTTAEPGKFVAAPVDSEPAGSPAAPASLSPPASSPAAGSKAAPSPAASSPGPSASTGQFQYIVQLGSFVDKGKAEEVRNILREKGYSPVVKPIKHNVLGRVYVIQLKPEPSFSKATTLVTQLGSEVPGEAVILKAPVTGSRSD